MHVQDSCDTRQIDGVMRWQAIHVDESGCNFIWREGRFVEVQRIGTRKDGDDRTITQWKTVAR